MYSGTHIIICFTHSDGSPTEVTDTLGVKPTKQWLKGDLKPPSKVKAKKSGWCLEIRSGNFEVEQKLNELLDSLTPLKDKFATLTERWIGEVRCASYFRSDESTPALFFDRSTIKRLSELSLGLDIDLYLLPEKKIAV